MTHKRLTYIESVVLAGLVLLFATATYGERRVQSKEQRAESSTFSLSTL